MIGFDEWLQARMAAGLEEAADLLRLALAEADEDPHGLLAIAQAIYDLLQRGVTISTSGSHISGRCF